MTADDVVKTRESAASEESSGKDRSARSAGPAAVVVVILLLLAPLFYVLSIGPVVWLNDRHYIDVQPSSLIAKFYAPLEYAHSNLPLVAKPLDWYVELWVKPPEAMPANYAPAMPTPAPVYVPSPAPPTPQGASDQDIGQAAEPATATASGTAADE